MLHVEHHALACASAFCVVRLRRLWGENAVEKREHNLEALFVLLADDGGITEQIRVDHQQEASEKRAKMAGGGGRGLVRHGVIQ
jgi:hypothetical protein